jgi:hypothetical protein
MTPEESEALNVLHAIAKALESINRQIFLIREMIQESRDEATDEEG